MKSGLIERLTLELGRRSWKRERVIVGTATDPYQAAEGRFRLTRGSVVELGRSRTPFGIITRGPLIIRDVDVLVDAARRSEVSVTFSVPTLDPEVWRRTEPGTPPPRQRLRALRVLIDAGIDANVGMAPILPGLSDDPKGISEVIVAARDAGATSVWANVLYLREGTRQHFLEQLARDWPALLPRYEAIYRDRAYAPKTRVQDVRERVADLSSRTGVRDRRIDPIHPPDDPIIEQLPMFAFASPAGLPGPDRAA